MDLLPDCAAALTQSRWFRGHDQSRSLRCRHRLPVCTERFWGREVLDGFLSLPMVMPPTVPSCYLLVLLVESAFRSILTANSVQLIFTGKLRPSPTIVTLPLVYKPARECLARPSSNKRHARSGFQTRRSSFRSIPVIPVHS